MKTTLSVIAVLACSTALEASAQTITSSTESRPYSGVRIVEGRTSGPATDFYAAYISLCSQSIHVDASSYGSSRSAGSWASTVGAQLAVNGDFYTASPRTHVYGDAVGSGTRWAQNRTGLHADYIDDWYYNRYGWIAFGDDWVEFSNTRWIKNNDLSTSGWRPNQVAPEPPPGTKALVSGFPQLVYDGQPITCPSATDSSCFPDRTDMRARHPRTAMGLTRDKQTFILVVVDGRSSSSAGMYGLELATLMKELGAYTAFNLDGGGSAQMWVSGEGTINRPSDGSPRSVVNHWGIFAGADNGLPVVPGQCDNRWEGLLHAMAGQVPRTSDLDGDGLGDACIRTADGVECATSSGAAFDAPFMGPALSDDGGWNDVSNYATMRWGDIDGDGRADLCARANAGMRCWRSEGDGFGDPITGPELSDAAGFDHEAYFSTIRLADFNGDGMDDICARWPSGIRCYPSTGDGFGPEVAGPTLEDGSGWRDVSNYGTIRVGDVDGDGKDDICARANAGMRCWITDGDTIVGPAWSDEDGWADFRQWSTIRLVDLDNDGRADLCGRAADGLRCALSTGTGFAAELAGPALSDASGWNHYSNYQTLRFADVTGDGNLDACARANAGIVCWPFDGSNFGPSITTALASDESGWWRDRHHRTLDFVDLDGDGMADLCGRANAGLVCWRSNGAGFEDELILGPAWGSDQGFNARKFYGTMTLLGAIRAPAEEPPEPQPGGDGGGMGGDDSVPGSTANPDGSVQPGPTGADSQGPDDTEDSERPVRVDAHGRAGGCTSAPPVAGGFPLLLLVGCGFAMRRRRRAGS